MSSHRFTPQVEYLLVTTCLMGSFLLAARMLLDRWQGRPGYDADQVQLPPPVFMVDLQTASEAELALLPDIGGELARRIVAARDQGVVFRTADDLRQVRGIGLKRQQAIAPFVVSRSAETTSRQHPWQATAHSEEHIVFGETAIAEPE